MVQTSIVPSSAILSPQVGESVVHRFEPHFLARHALGPGGDCALVAAIVCASGPLAEDCERDPLGKWAQALNVLEQVLLRT